MSNGIIIYDGPSVLDGAPIIVAASGIKSPSRNPKTGPMIQVWILVRDIAPHIAVRTGADSSICGDCQHRGIQVTLPNGAKATKGRTCYVIPFMAPRNVFEQYKSGGYTPVTLDYAHDIFTGRRVRIGAYGDPAAVPFEVWESVLAGAQAVTGYTHQWRNGDPRLARYCMASADSALDRELAKAKGYRVFRVKRADESRAPGEVVCPASAEAGQKTNCDKCLACGGLSAKARADIVIDVHGSTLITAFNARTAVA